VGRYFATIHPHWSWFDRSGRSEFLPERREHVLVAHVPEKSNEWYRMKAIIPAAKPIIPAIRVRRPIVVYLSSALFRLQPTMVIVADF
jgi:hypothetical protein